MARRRGAWLAGALALTLLAGCADDADDAAVAGDSDVGISAGAGTDDAAGPVGEGQCLPFELLRADSELTSDTCVKLPDGSLASGSDLFALLADVVLFPDLPPIDVSDCERKSVRDSDEVTFDCPEDHPFAVMLRLAEEGSKRVAGDDAPMPDGGPSEPTRPILDIPLDSCAIFNDPATPPDPAGYHDGRFLIECNTARAETYRRLSAYDTSVILDRTVLNCPGRREAARSGPPPGYGLWYPDGRLERNCAWRPLGPGETPPPGHDDRVPAGSITTTSGWNQDRTGRAGWDSSSYPKQPPIGPPAGATLRLVEDQGVSVRYWQYSVPRSTDPVELCRWSIEALRAYGLELSSGPHCTTLTFGLYMSEGRATRESILVTVGPDGMPCPGGGQCHQWALTYMLTDR